MTQPWGETPAEWTVTVGDDTNSRKRQRRQRYEHVIPDGEPQGWDAIAAGAPPLNLTGFNLTVGRALDLGLITERQYDLLLDDAATCGMGWLQRLTRKLPWT